MFFDLEFLEQKLEDDTYHFCICIYKALSQALTLPTLNLLQPFDSSLAPGVQVSLLTKSADSERKPVWKEYGTGNSSQVGQMLK